MVAGLLDVSMTGPMLWLVEMILESLETPNVVEECGLWVITTTKVLAASDLSMVAL